MTERQDGLFDARCGQDDSRDERQVQVGVGVPCQVNLTLEIGLDDAVLDGGRDVLEASPPLGDGGAYAYDRQGDDLTLELKVLRRDSHGHDRLSERQDHDQCEALREVLG